MTSVSSGWRGGSTHWGPRAESHGLPSTPSLCLPRPGSQSVAGPHLGPQPLLPPHRHSLSPWRPDLGPLAKAELINAAIETSPTQPPAGGWKLLSRLSCRSPGLTPREPPSARLGRRGGGRAKPTHPLACLDRSVTSPACLCTVASTARSSPSHSPPWQTLSPQPHGGLCPSVSRSSRPETG